jgi:hypothetical protein
MSENEKKPKPDKPKPKEPPPVRVPDGETDRRKIEVPPRSVG